MTSPARTLAHARGTSASRVHAHASRHTYSRAHSTSSASARARASAASLLAKAHLQSVARTIVGSCSSGGGGNSGLHFLSLGSTAAPTPESQTAA